MSLVARLMPSLRKSQCQRALVSMVLNCTNIPVPQPALTLSQLLMYNCLVRQSKTATITRHSQERETPLPIYLGIMVHTKTRKRTSSGHSLSPGTAFLMIGYWTYYITEQALQLP
jgi:hypothetical protein